MPYRFCSHPRESRLITMQMMRRRLYFGVYKGSFKTFIKVYFFIFKGNCKDTGTPCYQYTLLYFFQHEIILKFKIYIFTSVVTIMMV